MRSTPAHAIRPVPRVACVVGSARGRVRSENQDRAIAAIYDTGNPRLDFCAFIVCDGLGGMQEGEQCAADAASYFVTHLVSTASTADRAIRLRGAMQYANESLAETYQERGGTTLTAILFSHTGGTAISVGDTRLYKQHQKGEFTQLTVDDTIAGHLAELAVESTNEAKSPFANHLAQFVGQYGVLEPQVISSEKLLGEGGKQTRPLGPEGLLITTDGVHRLGKQTLSELGYGATSARELIQRLLTVSEWAGGVDNATAMWVSFQVPPSSDSRDRVSSPVLQLHDAHGDLYLPDAVVVALRQPFIPMRPPSMFGPTPRLEADRRFKSAQRKRPQKGKKKRKGAQSRKGKASDRDDKTKQSELDIKVTQHSE